MKIPTYTTEDIINIIQSQLEQLDIDDKVYSISVNENNAGNYFAEVTLNQRRKKIKQTLIATKLDESINKLCNTVYTYIEEGATISINDAYVILVSINGLDIGYIAEVASGRGQTWAYLCQDSSDAMRLKSPKYNRLYAINEFVVPEYISTSYRFIELSEGDMADRSYSTDPYYCVIPDTILDIEYIRLNEARWVPTISNREFENAIE